VNTILQSQYESLFNRYQTLASAKNRQLKILSLGRLVSFIGIIPVLYAIYPLNPVVAGTLALGLLVTFLFLVKKYIRTEKQLAFTQQLSKINAEEIRALNGDLSSFDPGSEFIDPHHDYSFDVDLYGPASLFQFLNRTATGDGKKRLSILLNQCMRTVDEIKSRQEAISGLADMLDWRQKFTALGRTDKNSKQPSSDEILKQTAQLQSEKFLGVLIKVLPVLTLATLIFNIAGIIPNGFVLVLVLLQWAIFIAYSKTISKFSKQSNHQSKLLVQISEMFYLIENQDFNSRHLQNLKAKLTSDGNTASQITAKLRKTLDEFDYRQNIIVGFILNSLFLWDVRCMVKLNDWQKKYSHLLPQWFDIIAEWDALNSLANYNFNHPQWTTPQVSDSEFIIIAQDAGHPLIGETRCVRNSFTLTKNEQIAIITGANMAGKSTFLRTIGINLILASNGCKVFAQNFEFSPIRLFTNMRTSDNLMNDESYFYAELLRLQSILTLLREGEKLFVIIDEMLKGTNSVDKLNGSKALIQQLIYLEAHGIVATHDLGLTEITNTFPSVKNQCFEVELRQNDLSFNYKLTDGVTRTMNATFLMKKMGIIPNII
jgi:hypothetical protein